MIINYLALFIAIALSCVAAYYSIIGLALIFSSALIPVIMMASTLEAGKVVAASWLYRNWNTAPKFICYYLVAAVIILMFITSMGIFGFLSKAHLDQNVVSGDAVTKLAMYEEKIKAEKENIDANRKALKQMDEAVDQTMGRSADEKGAEKAVVLRRTQQKERSRLLTEIAEYQKKISALNEERAPIASEVRKIEAEVGPIKYIAALMYGDNPDQNVLEKAVRVVIILLVVVFDPLASMLLLAANHSLGNQPPNTKLRFRVDKEHLVEPIPTRPPSAANLKEDEKSVATFNKKTSIENIIENSNKPQEEKVEEEEGWSPRWYQRAVRLIQRKKQGTIEIDRDSIKEMK